MINSQKNTGRNIKNEMLKLTGVKGKKEETDRNTERSQERKIKKEQILIKKI